MSLTRTTINIDLQLLETSKRLAHSRGISVDQFVAEAVRRRVIEEPTAYGASQVVLPTSGRGGVRVGINLDASRQLLTAMDEADDAW